MNLTSSPHIHWNSRKTTLGRVREMATMMLSQALELKLTKILLKAELMMTCTVMVSLDETNFVKFEKILAQLFVLGGKQALLPTLELPLMES
jgi:hypothetical protein